jgi:DNA-directed RNA polymerase specialized sigma24 family protein
MTSNYLNDLYTAWFYDPTPERLGDLLEGVRRAVVYYLPTHQAADDISQLTQLKVWRSLPGYSGTDPLKTYDPSRGKFAPFVASTMRSTRLNYGKYDRHIPLEDTRLEKVVNKHSRVNRYRSTPTASLTLDY